MTLFPLDTKTITEYLKEAQELDKEVEQIEYELQKIKARLKEKRTEYKRIISKCLLLSESQNIIN